ncbi:MAG: tRNA pseudouridine(38-40) synthase TruA [Chloroflexota bacterium]
MRYRATLAYDGAPFLGYQRQVDGTPTVQGTVEAALTRINGGESVTVYAAGRTDTGVHATGQVIAFDLAWRHGTDRLLRAVNGNLPDSVALLDVCETDPDFQPRFNALHRTYRYTLVSAPVRKPLLRHTTWVTQHPLEADRMREAAGLLRGKRDWGALGKPPVGDNTVRDLHGVWLATEKRHDEHWLVFTVRANAFLYRMVRRTVGMLYDVGRGRLGLDAFERMLDRAQIDSGVTIAPPQGLVLTRVVYPGDPDATLDPKVLA